MWSQCRKEDAKPTGHRTVFISDYHGTLCQAQNFNTSDEGKALLKTRWRVEQTIAWLTRYQGSRQVRCLGLKAAQAVGGLCNSLPSELFTAEGAEVAEGSLPVAGSHPLHPYAVKNPC
ncbi:MAG: hypothetical protein EI684_10085, partial [Candidatus Viridilinea halotolerans]